MTVIKLSEIAPTARIADRQLNYIRACVTNVVLHLRSLSDRQFAAEHDALIDQLSSQDVPIMGDDLMLQLYSNEEDRRPLRRVLVRDNDNDDPI